MPSNISTNDIILYLQCSITTIGLLFSGTMLIVGNNPNIYLPLFSSLIFSWMPSPISSKVNSDFQYHQSSELSSLHTKVLDLKSNTNFTPQLVYTNHKSSTPNLNQQQNANANPSVIIPINSTPAPQSSSMPSTTKINHKIV